MKAKYCKECRYFWRSETKYPCAVCNRKDIKSKGGETTEEINHPDRYAGGKFECIDVMQDVFGVEAVKHFCMLNAFKYIWRSEKKNGVEDVKKAVWYLNKCIELVESEGEKE